MPTDERVAERPMPLAPAIHWKPRHDSHYVVASLQPADGGRRKIFVRQAVLSRVEAAVRAGQGQRVFGLLLGRLYRCPVTDASYLTIESLAGSASAAVTDAELARTIEEAVANPPADGVVVVGWYCSAPAVEAKPPVAAAGVHAVHFPHPWQTALIVADGVEASGGAFFLHDALASRWFCAPFHELPSRAARSGEPKSTAMAWPQYVTAETVLPLREELVAGQPVGQAHAASEVRHTGGSRYLKKRPDHAPGVSGTPGGAAAAPVHDWPVQKVPVVDDREQRQATAARGIRRVGDSEDTTADDDPARYLELARAEGFFVAVKYATNGGDDEALWVLNEPYSGMLLTVATTDTAVLDATLHYNLRGDDAALHAAPVAHRDPASGTLYARERCMDQLRARCRRLRATEALERVWKVSPTIYFLSPSELGPDGGDADPAHETAIRALNHARIAVLPVGVRRQFRLTGPAYPDRPEYSGAGLDAAI